jgi:hypothetical protein
MLQNMKQTGITRLSAQVGSCYKHKLFRSYSASSWILLAGDTAATGDQYRDRCKEARSCGDVKNVPATRCSRDVFYNILRSEGDAVLDHVHAKLTSTKNPLKFLCWSEDSAKEWEQCVCRAVFSDRTWEDLLIQWHGHCGKKTGLEKAQAVKEVIRKFSKGRAHVVKAFEKCVAFQADGELAEQLSAAFMKVENTLPLRHAGRCGMHSKQKNMENSTGTDLFLKELLDMLIRNKAASKGPDLGGLCRAVKNRERMRYNFTADVERELDQLVKDLEELGEFWNGPAKMPTGKHTMSAAPQRFDSLLEGLRSIIWNIRGVVVFLVKLGTEWAKALLDMFMRPEFEAGLPALAEFLEIGRQYVHKDEGHDPDKSNLINSWSNFLDMKKDLNTMFRGDEDRPPLLASDKYTKGYYQLMQKSLNSLGDNVCYRSGTGAVLFRRASPTEEQAATSLALIMKRMQIVCEVFLEACDAEHLMARGAALLLHTTSWPWPS